MRKLSAIFCATCMLASLAAQGKTVFTDNFNSGAKPDWGNEAGQWRAEHGTYDASIPGNGTQHPTTYSDVTTHANLGDFTVKVTVKDVNDGGVWLRSAYNGGQINGVLLVTGGDVGSNNGFYWHTVQNGVFSGEMGNVSFPGLQGSTQKLKIVVKGDTYTLYVGSSTTALTSITTNLFPTGSVGLYDYSPQNGSSKPRGQVFDNFAITSP